MSCCFPRYPSPGPTTGVFSTSFDWRALTMWVLPKGKRLCPKGHCRTRPERRSRDFMNKYSQRHVMKFLSIQYRRWSHKMTSPRDTACLWGPTTRKLPTYTLFNKFPSLKQGMLVFWGFLTDCHLTGCFSLEDAFLSSDYPCRDWEESSGCDLPSRKPAY
jgi:hypothetical protein